MKPIQPAPVPAAEPRTAPSTKPSAGTAATSPASQEGVISAVTPSIQSPEEAQAALNRIQSALSPLGTRALDAFNPTDVAKIERLLSDD